MVGVPRSRGCSTCIKRRVKCDETKPACTKCCAYGVSCPGFEKVFKFVNQKHRRPQPLCDGKETSIPEDEVVLSIADFSASTSDRYGDFVFSSSENPESVLAYSITSSPAAYQTQLLSTWIEDISGKQSSIPDEVSIARLFCFIPALLGSSSALDSAVHCLTVHYFGMMQSNEEITRHGRLAYGKALCSIQKAINDPVEAIKSTTLCAIVILGTYELFASTKTDSWMKHTAGLSRLVQLRGPESFRNGFDSALILSCKGMMISEALFSGKACFLDSDKWKRIALELPGNSFSATFYEKTDELTGCVAACPWLVKEVFALRSPSKSKYSAEVRASALVNRTLEVYERLQHWYEDFVTFAPMPEEMPSYTEDDLYPIVYSYCNGSIATAFCAYYAMMIIVHRIFVECHHPAGDNHQINAMIDKICKSVEYFTGTGILGPYRAGFSLRIAFEMAPVITRLWIRKWLIQFEKLYGAISPDNYPPIEAEDHRLE